eukprot:SAG11_NODE_7100_length_1193_cov_2.434186_2_plen_93_part_00
MRHSEFALTAGAYTRIRCPELGASASIGIRRGGPDIHDHTASVRDGTKRRQLAEVRDERVLKGFRREQFNNRELPTQRNAHTALACAVCLRR